MSDRVNNLVIDYVLFYSIIYFPLKFDYKTAKSDLHENIILKQTMQS